MVTTGTSTAMLAPASCGFCCGGAGFGSTGGAPCCCLPPCGPSGAWALATPAKQNTSAPAKNPAKFLQRFAFMLFPSSDHDKWTCVWPQRSPVCERGARGWSYAIDFQREWLGVCSAHASMKQIRRKTFADATVSQGGIRVEDGLVNRKRRMCRPARLAGCFFAAALPLAAQGIPQSTAPTPVSTSAIGDTAGLAREANVWLAQLIQINTTNPPGNEQAAAKSVAGRNYAGNSGGHAGAQRGGGAAAELGDFRSGAGAAAGRAHGCGGRGA